MNNKGLNDTYNEVKAFHKAFNHPIKHKPTMLTLDRASVRMSWIEEEVDEFIQAVEDKDIVEQADAMIDVIYFAIGTLVELGVEPQQLFEIVQKANMSKLWEDGKPHYKNDGKVRKPLSWIDPHPLLKNEIERQIGENNEL